MFSSALRDGIRWKDWNTNPTLLALNWARPSSFKSERFIEFRTTFPFVGISNPAKRDSKVDFPEPEGPTTATDSPW